MKIRSWAATCFQVEEYIDGTEASEWLEAARAELASIPEVTLLPRTTVFGYYDHNHLTALERITDHLAAAPDRNATPAPLELSVQTGRAGDGRHRTFLGVPRQ